jgi:hypothetical protein
MKHVPLYISVSTYVCINRLIDRQTDMLGIVFFIDTRRQLGSKGGVEETQDSGDRGDSVLRVHGELDLEHLHLTT